MKCILNHPELKDVKSLMLATRDAHGLYSKFVLNRRNRKVYAQT